MKRKYLWHIMLVLPFIYPGSCEKSNEEQICNTAREFAKEYYGMNLQKACDYCARDLHPLLRYRAEEVTAEDREVMEEFGPMEVRVLNCRIRTDNDVAYVNIELRNFIRIDYLKGEYMKLPCDTIRLTLTRQNSMRWLVNHPI